MRDYDYYLFDADGTLFDTAELIYQCFVQTARKFADKEIDRKLVLDHIGLPLRQQLEVYLGSLTEEQVQQIRDFHMGYQLSIYRDYLRLYPTVREGLDRLKSAGKQLAIVTSRMPDTLTIYLRHTGIAEFFDTLVTPPLTQKHKPDPAPALKALALMGGSAERALFIGDAIFDIACGARAGMDTAFVAWSHNSVESLATKPTYVLEDVRHLTDGIERERKRP